MKCSIRDEMAGSFFCEVCARGIDAALLAPKLIAESPSRKSKHPFRDRIRSSRKTKEPIQSGLISQEEMERIHKAFSENLEALPVTPHAKLVSVRSDIRRIMERYPFDDIGSYDANSGSIGIDSDAVNHLSSVLSCEATSLEHVVRLHAVFHKAFHSYLGNDYLTTDHRLIEQLIHHMMFYLLIDPKQAKVMFPSLFHTFRRLSENDAYYRLFIAVHELQPEDCRVNDCDFAVYPPTWVIYSLSIVRRYHIKDFDKWHDPVFGRNNQPA